MAVANPITTPHAQEGLSRRNLLMSLPLAGLGTVGAASTPDAAETEVMRLFRDWRLKFDVLDALSSALSVLDFEAAQIDLNDIQNNLLSATSVTPTDVLAKLTVFTFNGRHFADDDGTWSQRILAEARTAVYGDLS